MTGAEPTTESRQPQGNLVRRTVLLTRDGEHGQLFGELLRAQGGYPLFDPLQVEQPSREGGLLMRAVRDLGRGGYDWVVLTSARSVDALVAIAPDGQVALGGARVAVVGRATARAAQDRGITPDLVPETQSAAGLLAAWPLAPRTERVLLPCSALASGTLQDGLTTFGAQVTRVEAYWMQPTPPTVDLTRAIAQNRLHAVVLTSGSAAHRVAQVLASRGASAPEPLIVAIGAATADAAANAGLTVSATSPSPDPADLLTTLDVVMARLHRTERS